MKKKIEVGILGATGAVGQRFIELLHNHPWFEVVCLMASDRSAGKKYGEAVRWVIPSPLPERIATMTVRNCTTEDLPCSLFFSGLDSSVAGEIETEFAQKGCYVISNSRNHRMDPHVPLLIPEVNPDHLQLLQSQSFKKGRILTNPNCSVIGLVMALYPLDLLWKIEEVNVVTLQAVSGAGYPGVASLDILENVIPYISGEEDKLETEPLKIMGTFSNETIIPHSMKINAQCNRVPVIDGHMACVSIKLQETANDRDIITAWNTFSSLPQQLLLPSAPEKPLIYFSDERFPQPRLHRNLCNGMSVSIGRLQPSTLFDWKFVVLSHNTVRGAAGCALLNAELMLRSIPSFSFVFSE